MSDPLSASKNVHFLIMYDSSMPKSTLDLNFYFHFFEKFFFEIKDPKILKDFIIIFASVDD